MSYERVGRILILICALFTIILSLLFLLNSGDLHCGPIDSAIWGQYGDVIGGFVGTIVALVGVLLLFETLKAQRRIYIKQQVESRFFELIKIHRDNVSEMQSKGKKGRSVFIDIKDQFHDLFNILVEHFTLSKSGISEPKWEKIAIQVVYLIIFFGVDNSSTEYLRKKIKLIINNDSVYKDIDALILTPLVETHKKAKIENTTKLKTENRTYLKYDGHQSRLGHYYRHLFQTVKYINEQPALLFSYKEKYDYIKILRAQLGTHEQALLLYNSISPLGEPWELASSIKDENQKLITKYNLIKNLPSGFTREIDPKDYYPNVNFEIDDYPTTQRIELIKFYLKAFKKRL